MTNEAARSTATIKFGKGYDAPWLVLGGGPSEIRSQIVEAFGLGQAVDHYNLDQLIALASTKAATALSTTDSLGATVISNEPSAPQEAATPAPAPTPVASADQSDPWSQAEKAAATAGPTAGAGEAAPQTPSLLDRINAAETEKQLRELWRDNKAHWNDDYTKAAADRTAQLAA